jgi:gas vesicle protein
MPAREYETKETNQNNTEDSSNNFLLGAIVGGLIGAAAALLFAPKSGKDLRNTLKDGPLMEKTVQFGENMVNIGNEFVSKTSAVSQDIVQQSTDLLKKTKGITKTSEGNREGTETNYIPIGGSVEDTEEAELPLDTVNIRRKLEETERALEEEENKVKH